MQYHNRNSNFTIVIIEKSILSLSPSLYPPTIPLTLTTHPHEATWPYPLMYIIVCILTFKLTPIYIYTYIHTYIHITTHLCMHVSTPINPLAHLLCLCTPQDRIEYKRFQKEVDSTRFGEVSSYARCALTAMTCTYV